MAEQNYTQQELKWIAEAEAQGIMWLWKTRTGYGKYRLACGHEREIQITHVRNGLFKCVACQDQKFKDEAKAQGITWLGKTRSKCGKYRLPCGHEREIQITHVRKGHFKCEVCYEQKLKDEAEANGIKWLGKSRSEYGYYRLACGHEREIEYSCVRKGYFKCEVCYEQKIKDEAEAQGITWLGKTRPECGKYRLPCGHEREIAPGNVRKGHFKCEVCYEQKLKDEAEANGIKWLGKSRSEYGYYRLACGHEREIEYSCVRKGYFKCHVCKESWVTKPSQLYVLHIEAQGESLIKVGISSNVDRRISRYGLPDEANVTVIKTVQFDNGLDAHKAEQSLLRKFKRFRLKGVYHILRDSGHTECFCPTALNEILAAA